MKDREICGAGNDNIALMIDQGLSVKEMSELLGCEEDVVELILQNLSSEELTNNTRKDKELHRDNIFELFVNKDYSLNQIGKELNISAATIRDWLISWGFTNTGDKLCGEKGRKINQYKTEVLADYADNMSIKALSEKYKFAPSVVHNLLRKEGAKIRPTNTRKYEFDESYFKKIDSEPKAYNLGMLYSDGNVMENGRIRIALNNTDGYILYNMAKYAKSTGGFYNTKKGENRKIQLVWDVGRPNVVEDLIKLGCHPRKSLTLKWPTPDQVSDDFIPHFLRGVFDGDGSISIKWTKTTINGNANVTGSNAFIAGMNKFLVDRGIAKIPKVYWRYSDKKTAQWFIMHQSDQVSFFNYIYPAGFNQELCLWRKYMKFNMLVDSITRE
jgi:transposase